MFLEISSLKIAQGESSPKTHKKNWTLHKAKSVSNGIAVVIDTKEHKFTKTPHYIVSLEGDGYHWFAIGVNSLYNASKTGFKVILRWADKEGHPTNEGGVIPITVDFAKQNNWKVRWTAIEN